MLVKFRATPALPFPASHRLTQQDMTAGFQCAGCGEWNETTVDSSAGRRQQYIEDCQVCCKPNDLSVSWDAELEEFLVSAQLE